MKLRIHGNTLRLRLTRGRRLPHCIRTARCRRAVQFGDAKLVYRLQKGSEDGAIRAKLAGATITVHIPADTVDNLGGIRKRSA